MASGPPTALVRRPGGGGLAPLPYSTVVQGPSDNGISVRHPLGDGDAGRPQADRDDELQLSLGFGDSPQLPADIGVATSAYAKLPLVDALRRIAAMARRAEIRSSGRHSLLDERNRALAARIDLAYTVHGPFSGVPLWDLDESRRLAALDEHLRHIRASAEIGARFYVAHPDWQAGGASRDPAVVTQLARSFDTLREWQNEYGIAILIENMPGAGKSHFTHPGGLDLRGLDLVLDIGHASISGCLEEWLRDPHARLRHMHLHDNRGAGDDADPHLPLGAGVIDVAAAIAAARAAGATMVLEHNNRDDLLASVAHLGRLGLL
jgi:sugar phosphate isomerase/epimerase